MDAETVEAKVWETEGERQYKVKYELIGIVMIN